VRERFQAQHVVQVDQQLVVAVGEGYIPRHAETFPQPLDRGELAGPGGPAEGSEFGVAEIPAGPGQDQPAADDAGQERSLPQGAPVPHKPGIDLLVLERAQEAVDTETPPDMVMRGREPRDDLAPEPT
jgi:hypothetical protein